MKQVTMLFGDRQQTAFMQHMDVFERFKVIMNRPVTTTVIDDFGDSNVAAVIKACDDSPVFLIAIYDRSRIYFRNQEVRVVSDGHKFLMLDDILPTQEAHDENAMVALHEHDWINYG